MTTVTTIIVAVLGAIDIVQMIMFFVGRHDQKKGIQERLKVLEKDTIRTQLLMLVLLKPEESQEILTVAKHYFAVLKGDWYMTSIFNKWLIDNGTAEPEWFDKND